MKTQILDGGLLAKQILTELSVEIKERKLNPRLLILQVGNNAASTQYVNIKKKRAAEIGAAVIHETVGDSDALVQNVARLIEKYRSEVNGIMIQLPLPTTTNTKSVLNLIPPNLDVDGLLLEKSPFHTAVAGAVCEILIGIQDARTKRILVIGDAPYVGGSILRALKDSNYTNITVVNEFTENNEMEMKEADIVISCVGKPHIFKETQFKDGAVLIDVGTSPDITGTIVGDVDVDFESGYLTSATPVPGGVGPVTVAILLRNLVTNSLVRG